MLLVAVICISMMPMVYLALTIMPTNMGVIFMGLNNANNNSSNNKSFRKWVRVNDEKYDYYIDISDVNKKSVLKWLYKYRGKTCPVIVFNKADSIFKDNNFLFIGSLIGLLIWNYANDNKAEVNSFNFSWQLCLIIAFCTIIINQLLYLRASYEIKKRMSREKYYVGTIAVEYDKVYYKKKTMQGAFVIGSVFFYICLFLLFIIKASGNFYRLFGYVSLLYFVFYFIRLFPKINMVDYIIKDNDISSFDDKSK